MDLFFQNCKNNHFYFRLAFNPDINCPKCDLLLDQKTRFRHSRFITIDGRVYLLPVEENEPTDPYFYNTLDLDDTDESFKSHNEELRELLKNESKVLLFDFINTNVAYAFVITLEAFLEEHMEQVSKLKETKARESLRKHIESSQGFLDKIKNDF